MGQCRCFCSLPAIGILPSWYVICICIYVLHSNLTFKITFSLVYAGTASRNAFFGQGRGPILMEYVRCSGFEESLVQCDHNGFGYSTCGHFEDAGVACQGEMLYLRFGDG